MALQCPATLLLAPTPRDAKAVGDLLASLTGELVLAVVRAPGVTAAERIAQEIGAPLEDEPGLASAQPDPAVLGEIADLHRGETVLVLTTGGGRTPVVRLELD
ncbi:MAG: hypothetical protein ACTMHL_11490 [Janibacter sp.]